MGTLTARRVADGVVFDDLCAGEYVVTEELWLEFEKMSNEGGLYPFRISDYRYDSWRRIYTVTLVEG